MRRDIMESIHGAATRIKVVRDNCGRLEWSIKPEEWDGARVNWETPAGNHEPAQVVVVREDRSEALGVGAPRTWFARSVGDHGVSDRFKTEVIYLQLRDGTRVSCEHRAQLVRLPPYEGRR